MIYTLYNVVRHNTEVKGYWLDNSGKVYIDNIELINCHSKEVLKEHITDLFNKKELAVFYTDNKQGIIEDNKKNVTILSNRQVFKYKTSFENVKIIKGILSKFKGCTVYQKKGYINIEVFTK